MLGSMAERVPITGTIIPVSPDMVGPTMARIGESSVTVADGRFRAP